MELDDVLIWPANADDLMNVLNMLQLRRSWHDLTRTLVMNMMKTRARFEDSDVRWIPTNDNDPSKRRCDGLDAKTQFAPTARLREKNTALQACSRGNLLWGL